MAHCRALPRPAPLAALPDTTRLNADSDAALLAAFQRGDSRAFERLYARHEAALYRFVRRLLGREAEREADEVCQDTWLRAIQARQGWREDDARGASFRTWLFTIAHHRAVDSLRKSGREVSTTVDDANGTPWEPDTAAGAAWSAWPEVPSGDTTPEDRFFWRAAGQRLLDCLEGLPLTQKTAFLMHHDDGVPVAELARALNIGFETAKTRVRYAVAKLRACMGAYLPAAQALGDGVVKELP